MPRDECFPNETFVQKALEAHFQSRGFVAVSKGYTDLVVDHPESGERWVIEAKGETEAVGLDFRTGLGQLVQGMDEVGLYTDLQFPILLRFGYKWTRHPSGSARSSDCIGLWSMRAGLCASKSRESVSVEFRAN